MNSADRAFFFTVFAGAMLAAWLIYCASQQIPAPPTTVVDEVHFKAIVTAYCPCEECCGRWADGFTASNHKIARGDRFVAAPSAIPFGYLVSVPGYEGGAWVPVRDRGGSIRGPRIDVFFDSHDEALAWGVRELLVTAKSGRGAE